MTSITSVDVLGIVATLVMLYSFTQTEYRKLQQANIIADSLFALYGVLLGSTSVTLLNISLAIATAYMTIHCEGFRTAMRFGILIAFSVLCIASCVLLSSPQVEYLGAIANIIMMLGFTSPRQKMMRACGISASLVYVTYGIICSAVPLIVSNSIAICMHCVALWKVNKGK